MKQLVCKEITIAYEKENVVENVSFEVEEGDYVSVVGENGTGKSSIFKAILGLVPLRSGSITFADEIKKSGIGYLSQQNPMQKDFPASVLEVVLSGCLNRKGIIAIFHKKDRAEAKEALRKLGIEDLANQSFADLSGGQKQRVLLARALLATKKIMFLDEPITGLDPVAMKDMYEMIEKLNKELHITIVMVSHDIENAIKYSNKILSLTKDGYFFGTKENFLKQTAEQE